MSYYRPGHSPEEIESREIRNALDALGIKESARQIVKDLPRWRDALAAAQKAAEPVAEPTVEDETPAPRASMTVKEYAAKIGLTANAVYAQLKRGTLVADKVGGRWAIPV